MGRSTLNVAATMNNLSIGSTAYPVTGETRWRFRFSLLTVVATVALISWGGFVTSIDAGLAVPDWPASFGSYDPFATGFEDPTDPSARWWHSLPVLAEHGHRLLGALVGILTLILAVWTWRADPRSWMRTLGVIALGLVILQGILGGLRVVWVSLDLAVVHACAAQLFFAVVVAMTLFTSSGWLTARSLPPAGVPLRRLRTLATVTVVALYLQIVLGAFLRHPGAGTDPLFASVHITGAFVIVGLIFACFAYVWKYFDGYALLRRSAWSLLAVVALQFTLGLSAYVVLLYESQRALRSVTQITLTSAHVVVGALLMASTVVLTLLVFREPGTPTSAPAPAEHPASLPSVN